jgi:hypothetical protein
VAPVLPTLSVAVAVKVRRPSETLVVSNEPTNFRRERGQALRDRQRCDARAVIGGYREVETAADDSRSAHGRVIEIVGRMEGGAERHGRRLVVVDDGRRVRPEENTDIVGGGVVDASVLHVGAQQAGLVLLCLKPGVQRLRHREAQPVGVELLRWIARRLELLRAGAEAVELAVGGQIRLQQLGERDSRDHTPRSDIRGSGTVTGDLIECKIRQRRVDHVSKRLR